MAFFPPGGTAGPRNRARNLHICAPRAGVGADRPANPYNRPRHTSHEARGACRSSHRKSGDSLAPRAPVTARKFTRWP